MNDLIAQRINNIRQWLESNNYDAFIIPHEDEYLGEYVPEHNERLLWATGFTGSAGVAVITKTKAAIFVDGRYTVQVTKQAPAECFEYKHLINDPFLQWVTSVVPTQGKVAFDPRMHRSSWLTSAQANYANAIQLLPVSSNPIDEL